MEKILLGIDATSVDINTVDFACYLANLTHSKLTGVFLENLVYEERHVLNESERLQYEGLFNFVPEIQEKKRLAEQNIIVFKEACKARGVNCQVHRDRGVPADDMIKESRFSDVIILDAETSFKKKYEGTPTKFVKDVLKDAECPIIISPESFEGIDEIVFTYDGSKSSVFAIKEFTHLLPELKNKKVIILEINKENDTIIEEKHKLSEWLNSHYSNYEFEILQGKAKDKLFEFFLMKKNIFIVMGAYGRGMVSNFFNHSQSELVLNTTNLPIFIAHQ